MTEVPLLHAPKFRYTEVGTGVGLIPVIIFACNLSFNVYWVSSHFSVKRRFIQRNLSFGFGSIFHAGYLALRKL